MKRAILFRFHKNASFCSKKIEYYKELNPHVPIYGLGEDINGVEDMFEAGLEDNYVIENKDDRWKWLNGDMAVLNWYNNFGKDIDFDMLHVIEWDLLITSPLEDAFSHLSPNSVALSGVLTVPEARKYDWDWVSGGNYHSYMYMKNIAEETYSRCSTVKIGLFPGVAFSRRFLEKYSKVKHLSELLNDEVRVGLFGSHMEGITIRDTGFYDGWGSTEPSDVFNCKNHTVPTELVLEEGDSNPAYHPHREDFVLNEVLEAVGRTPRS